MFASECRYGISQLKSEVKSPLRKMPFRKTQRDTGGWLCCSQYDSNRKTFRRTASSCHHQLLTNDDAVRLNIMRLLFLSVKPWGWYEKGHLNLFQRCHSPSLGTCAAAGLSFFYEGAVWNNRKLNFRPRKPSPSSNQGTPFVLQIPSMYIAIVSLLVPKFNETLQGHSRPGRGQNHCKHAPKEWTCRKSKHHGEAKCHLVWI